MRKLLFGVFLFGFIVNLHAQDEPISNDYNKWQARLRLISVIPNESASIQGIGGDVDISTAVVPELDFTYFFTKNWAAELILATANHDVKAVNTSAGNIDLGDVWLLPPTLTVQYHFYADKFKPYVGAGVNYTIFYSADEGNVADNIDYDNGFGFAFQGGVDFSLSEKWFLNLDAKYLLLSTDATVDATTALGATVKADVDINPLILGFGIGMKF